MARVDDYKNAAELSRRALAGHDPQLLAGFSGGRLLEQGDEAILSLAFLGQDIHASWPEVNLSRAGSKDEIPIQQQVLILHYLEGAWRSKGPALTGEWIAFQDVPDGKFYQDAFQRRAKVPFVKGFGDRPGLLAELAGSVYKAESIHLGDVSVAVAAFPMIRAALVLWAGDDEFPAEGNILFDGNTPSYLSAEDMAWLSGMIVYPLVGMAAAANK